MGEPVGNSCPGCGDPAQWEAAPQQFFCGNDDCHVLTWNPTLSLGDLSEDPGFIPMGDLRRMFGLEDPA